MSETNNTEELACFFDSPEIRQKLTGDDDGTGEGHQVYQSLSELPFHHLRKERVRDHALLNAGEGAKVLEVGCGSGALGLDLVKLGFDYRGIDISPEMISDAKKKFDLAGVQSGRFEVRDFLADIQAEDEEVDVVVADGVICYHPDQVAFLSRVADLLKPGGSLVISHRNALFNLFALNNGSLDFVRDMIGSCSSLGGTNAMEAIPRLFPQGLRNREIPLNSQLLRTHENPLEIADLYKSAGLTVMEIEYSYLHPTPPGVEFEIVPEDYLTFFNQVRASWQGMLMGSQFIVVAKK